MEIADAVKKVQTKKSELKSAYFSLRSKIEDFKKKFPRQLSVIAKAKGSVSDFGNLTALPEVKEQAQKVIDLLTALINNIESKVVISREAEWYFKKTVVPEIDELIKALEQLA